MKDSVYDACIHKVRQSDWVAAFTLLQLYLSQLHVLLLYTSTGAYLALLILHAIVHAQETATSPPQLGVLSTGVSTSGGRSWNIQGGREREIKEREREI